MTELQDAAPAAGQSADAPPLERRPDQHRLRSFLSVRNVGAIYVWIAIIVLFSIVSPDVFPTTQTAKSILNQYAVTGMVAVALVVPLAAGVYDLSIGSVVALSGVLVAYLLANTSLSPVIVVIIVLLACVLFGLTNAFVVVRLRVDSFIATLGTGAILLALASAVSGDETITGRVGEGYANLASNNVGGVTLPVFYLLAIMVGIGYWLERTQSGREVYATGFDAETARLTGVPVARMVTLSFVTSATIAGFAGLVLAARLNAGSADVGTAYLIPAFSAAFLGATQLRGGRFNPWGTVIGVMLLGTGNIGLLVSGGPTWTPGLFEGVVLIAAVALTSLKRDAAQGRARRWPRRRS